MADLKELSMQVLDKLIALRVEAYVAIAVVLLTIFIFFIFVGKRKKSDTILLTGLSGSGKTALFFQLKDGTGHEGTVTSMEENVERFFLHSDSNKQSKAKPIRLVDVPGHLKLRSKLDEYITSAAGVVFLVDAADFMPNVRATSEYLYDILSKTWVVKKKIPVLIVCNKMDKVTAHSIDFIRKQLEKEIDKLRVTRHGVSDADEKSEVSIGKDGEPFKLSHCVNKVSVSEASVTTNQIAPIHQFIREHTGC